MSDCKHKWEKRWVATKRSATNINEGGVIAGSHDYVIQKITKRKVCKFCGKRKYTMFPFVRRTKKFKQVVPYGTKASNQLKRASKHPGVF